ncbi:MAG: hypothetical protein HQM12_23935 [SAR324 cluster bacterium]|nr:hypothetical protein [SAR324 cluster bacterium]MBF0350476.1 hypothetical protein [SAR324 cluster bacterium]
MNIKIFLTIALLQAGIFTSLYAADYTGKIITEYAYQDFGIVLVPEKNTSVTPQSIAISQKGKIFRPPLLIVPQGSSVNFSNDDEVKHNAWSMSKIRRFDLGLLDEGDEPIVKFNEVGVVEVFCNIHQNMYMAVWVVNTPFYTYLDEQYNFSIKNVPDGVYQVEVRHNLTTTPPQIDKINIQGNTITGPREFQFSKDTPSSKIPTRKGREKKDKLNY